MVLHPRTPEWVLETLVDSYLDPNELWFLTFVDRRERTLFCTANRHYCALDEPGRPLDPALDALLTRFEGGDEDLVVVPRMTRAERERHLDEFAATLPGAARLAFDARQRELRERWDRHWRPGSFRELCAGLDEETSARWKATLVASATSAIARFREAHAIPLEGIRHLVFD